MSSNALPLPPRPDPVSLDLIYERMTSPDVPLEDRAYHLVALSTVAFHPSVKLFLFEHTPVPNSGATDAAGQAEKDGASLSPNCDISASVAKENQRRREEVLKSAAFFLAQRSHAVAQECRWETVSLIGEMCRMENLATSSRNNNGGASSNIMNNNNNNANSGAAYYNAAHILSPMFTVAQKINMYAKANLEYLAQLPWFIPVIRELIGDEQTDISSSRSARRAARGAANKTAPNDLLETDEDVRLALKDILAALPTAVPRAGESGAEISWTAGQLEQSQDLMFLDASTTMLHLIPLVTQNSHAKCAHCEKQQKSGGEDGKSAFLRCGSCKAVFYCGAECQRAHWAAAHRVPCKAYKERCDAIAAQYAAMNLGKRKQKKKSKSNDNNNNAGQATVAVLEVPLEPSLFFVTRRYLYDHRDTSFADVPFDDYFMKYTVRGS